jgi:hypothetical protein
MRPVAVLLAPLILCLIAAEAAAADLSTRIAEAKAESATPSGAEYDQKLGPLIGQAMRSCIPPGATAPENLGSFALVARVGADGRQREVEVDSNTRVAACFKSRFAAFNLPPPPSSPGKREDFTGYPIVVEMTVSP